MENNYLQSKLFRIILYTFSGNVTLLQYTFDSPESIDLPISSTSDFAKITYFPALCKVGIVSSIYVYLYRHS